MADANQPIFRFAPSPNGELHLGHAYSALLNLEMAREAGGKILLRIEDIDSQRCTSELEKQMLKDLEWIGFEWDEEPLRQSERFDAYQETLDAFWKEDLIYPAILSRSEIKKRVLELGNGWPHDPDGAPHYPGNERDFATSKHKEIIDAGVSYTLRLDMTKAIQAVSRELYWNENNDEISAKPEQWGDVVLARRDTPTSYHLSSVIDDALQNITHIVRGKDLYHATSAHTLLQSLLRFPKPRYHHHNLIMDHGRKLSKSNKDTSLKQLREAGKTKEDIHHVLGFSP